jgi:hypothetical protein
VKKKMQKSYLSSMHRSGANFMPDADGNTPPHVANYQFSTPFAARKAMLEAALAARRRRDSRFAN